MKSDSNQNIKVQCVFIYIKEILTHSYISNQFANDVKVFGSIANKILSNNFNVEKIKHSNIEDRYSRLLITMESWNESLKSHNKENKINEGFILLMDNMNNDMVKSFNCLPDRWTILYKHKVVYKGRELPSMPYKKHVDSVDKWLNKNINA
eukprot:51548_1